MRNWIATIILFGLMCGLFTAGGLAGYLITNQTWWGATIGTSVAWFLFGVFLRDVK